MGNRKRTLYFVLLLNLDSVIKSTESSTDNGRRLNDTFKMVCDHVRDEAETEIGCMERVYHCHKMIDYRP